MAITARSQERIHRLAYDLEHMAARARQQGLERLANSLKDLSSKAGHLARDDDLWRTRT